MIGGYIVLFLIVFSFFVSVYGMIDLIKQINKIKDNE